MDSFSGKISKPVNDVTISPFANKKPEPLMPDIMEEENKLSAAKDNDAAEQQFSNEPGAEQKPEQHALAEENAETDPDMQWQRDIAAKIKQARENDPNMQWRRGIEAKIIEYNQNDPNMQWRRGIEAKIIEYNQNDPNKQWRRGIEAKIIEYNQNDPNMQWRRGIEAKLEARSKAQLSVSQPGDSKELEADKKSEEVMGVPLTPEGGIQRLEEDKDTIEDKEELSAKSAGSGGELSVDAATKDYINNLPAGQSLPLKIKNFFQTRFGRSFNKVKIHNDRQANEATAAINAKAFTKGNDIVFGKGQYQPETIDGKKLIAHELTHVAQQGGEIQQIQRYVLPTDWCDYIGLGIDTIERIYIELAYEEGDEKDFQRFVNNLFFVIDGVFAATPGAGGGGLVVRGSRSMAAAGWGAIPVSVKITIAEKLAKKMGWTTAKALQMANRFFSVAANSGGGGEKDIKEIYNSIKDAPNYPKDFKTRVNGTKKNNIKDKELAQNLKKIENGKWKKVYKDGYTSNGEKISLHYFQSPSGKIFNLKIRKGWSN